MKLGYARVSTPEQNLDLQLHALNAVGCDAVFQDEGVSALAPSRPGFEALLSALGEGDTLLTWRIDRAFRSTLEAILTVQGLSARGVKISCTAMSIDLTTPEGRKWFRDCVSQAEYEREVISARTRAGMAAAKARGATIGRPRALSRRKQKRAMSLLASGALSVSDVASRIGVGRATLYRHMPAMALKCARHNARA